MKSLAHAPHCRRASERLGEVCLRCPGQLLPVPDSAHSGHRLVFAQVRRLRRHPAPRGSFPFFRAFTDNTFASQLVRVQTERGQHVIDTGVYGFVRHPMYLGGTLVFVGGALLLGSISGLLVALAMVGLMVVRIFGEEKLLARDLEGYGAYREKVRYRLIPHVWWAPR